MGDTSNRKIEQRDTERKEQSPFNISIAQLFMYAALGVIGLLFTGLIFAHAYTLWQMNLKPVGIPNIFHANTVIILSSSLLLKVGSNFLQREEYREYAFSLLATFTLGLTFIIFQAVGWLELFQNGVYLNGEASGSYLYLISGLHLLHILGGCGPLVYLIYKAYQLNTDPVKELVFSTDPGRFQTFQLFSTYWHFIGILWVAIYTFFIVMNIATQL